MFYIELNFHIPSIKQANEILEFMTSHIHKQKWNNGIKSCRILETLNFTSNVIHTVYKKTFLVGEREYVEKEYILPASAITDSGSYQLCVYSSSMPTDYEYLKKAKITAQTVMRVMIFRVDQEEEIDETKLR